LLLGSDLDVLKFGEFLVYARPDGERCLLTSGKGKTMAYNLQGHFINQKFKSSLPNGGLNPS